MQARSWVGVAKGLPNVDNLASIAVHGAPVHAYGFGDIDIPAALAYNNHSSVVPYTNAIINKVHEGAQFGRALVFPLRLVNGIMGLRLSPLTVVAFISKTGVIHYLAFASSPSS